MKGLQSFSQCADYDKNTEKWLRASTSMELLEYLFGR